MSASAGRDVGGRTIGSNDRSAANMWPCTGQSGTRCTPTAAAWSRTCANCYDKTMGEGCCANCYDKTMGEGGDARDAALDGVDAVRGAVVAPER